MAFTLPAVPLPPFDTSQGTFITPQQSSPPASASAEPPLPEPTQPNPLIESSPYQAHLGTNYAPTTQELTHIRTLIASHQTGVESTLAEIQRLQDEITRLHRFVVAPKRDFIRQHAALLTPLRQVPVEILQEIFWHCTVQQLGGGGGGSLHKDDAPMSLTRVCREWREVALGCPSLWSRMHIAVPTETESSNGGDDATRAAATARAGAGAGLVAGPRSFLERRLVAVQKRLERTGSLPLDITIYQQLPSPPLYYELEGPNWSEAAALSAMEKMIHVLRPYVPRWRKMVLKVPFVSFRLFVDILSDEMEALEECHFNVNMPRSGNWGRPLELSRCKALGSPRVKKISLLNLPSGENFSLMPIRWENLTHLVLEGDLHFSNATPYLRILDLAKGSLQSFRCKVSIGNLPFHPMNLQDSDSESSLPGYEDTVIELPHLRELIVQETDGPAPMIGKTIRCPVLEVLEYHEVDSVPAPNPPMPMPIPPMAAPPLPIPPAMQNLQNMMNNVALNVNAIMNNFNNFPLPAAAPPPPPPPPPPPGNGSLSAILAHSGTFIKILTLNPHMYTLEQIFQYLSWTPQVETLKMIQLFSRPGPVQPIQHAKNAQILEAFYRPNPDLTGGVLCPCLRALAWGNSSRFTRKQVLDFLTAKQSATLGEGVAKMEKIAIHLGDAPSSGLGLGFGMLLPFAAVQYGPFGSGGGASGGSPSGVGSRLEEFRKEAMRLVPGEGAVYVTSDQVPAAQLIRAGMYNGSVNGVLGGGLAWGSDYSGMI